MYEDSSREMKVELIPGISSMSGKAGAFMFRTYKRPNGKTETRAYIMPRNGSRCVKGVCHPTYGSKRTTPLSEKEKQARQRFTEVQNQIANMSPDEMWQYSLDFKIGKHKFNGKTYATLRGYIAARLYAQGSGK